MQNTQNNTAIWPAHLNTLQADEQVDIYKNIIDDIKHFLEYENIPLSNDTLNIVQTLYIPFANWLITQRQDKTLVVGINGSQGSGKTTLNKILRIILEQSFKQTVVSFSIDDLYKTKQQRRELADNIHPLLLTRGVPGTHDTKLGISIFEQLIHKTQSHCDIPVFDKASDEQLPIKQWNTVKSHCDIILFEGWCVGSSPQLSSELDSPVNSLEAQEDKDGRWRAYINRQLQTAYAELFSFIDIQLMLKIPDFSMVFEWRRLQESKLAARLAEHPSALSPKVMNDNEIKRFIMHFERITRHTLKEMPARCNVVFELGNQHQIDKVIANRLKP